MVYYLFYYVYYTTYTKNLLNHHINIMLMNVIQFKSNHHTKYFAWLFKWRLVLVRLFTIAKL